MVDVQKVGRVDSDDITSALGIETTGTIRGEVMSDLLGVGQPSWVVCIFDVARSRSEKQWPLFFKIVEKIMNVALARTYASTYGR